MGEIDFNSGGAHVAANFMTGGDEFGLPIFARDKRDLVLDNAEKVFGKMSSNTDDKFGNGKDNGCVSGAKDLLGKEKQDMTDKVFVDLSQPDTQNTAHGLDSEKEHSKDNNQKS